jgi:hypothetical protein
MPKLVLGAVHDEDRNVGPVLVSKEHVFLDKH